MEDLEKMLLEAAGRTDTNTNPNPITPSRAGKVVFSDDSSDDSDKAGFHSKESKLLARVPIKKRMFEAIERYGSKRIMGSDDDNVHEYSDGMYNDDDDASFFGSDLYKGDKDREKLPWMSEIEREMVFKTPPTKRSDNRGLADNFNNESIHSTRSKSARQSALQELVKQRKNAAARKVLGRRYSRVAKRNPRRSESSSSKSDEESTDASDETDDSTSYHEDEDLMSRAEFEDIKKISISRSKLEKWYREPFFDELIVGCFVRVGICRSKSGPTYRLCIVRNVDATDTDRAYKFGRNRSTHKFLNVVCGNENSSARWQMAVVSNSPPLRHEFDHLVEEADRYGGYLPTKQEVLEKMEEIKKTKSFVYSAETVKHMLEEKRSTSRLKPSNIAAEKIRLRNELEMAKEDVSEVERIKSRLDELEAIVREKHNEIDNKAIRLEQMNKMNKAQNLASASKQSSTIHYKGSLWKAGESGHDPFSRRWTRPRNYFTTQPVEGGTRNEGSEEDEKGTLATEEAMKEAEKEGRLVDLNYAVVDPRTDEFKLHDFELTISLSKLQEFARSDDGFRAGYLARKMWMEARYGSKVEEKADDKDDGNVISIEEYYKRRRGMI